MNGEINKKPKVYWSNIKTTMSMINNNFDGQLKTTEQAKMFLRRTDTIIDDVKPRIDHLWSRRKWKAVSLQGKLLNKHDESNSQELQSDYFLRKRHSKSSSQHSRR